MALEKLKILVELPNTKLQFSDKHQDGCIVAMFNPNRLTISRTASWQSEQAAKRDSPELQFTTAEPSTLSLDLFFDTYDSPEPELKKESVRKYTDQLLLLTTVEKHGDKHRPPVCQLQWGKVFFQGVLQQMELQFTLFAENGTPVRATVRCTFKQWRTNNKDLAKQMLESADVAKVWVVKRGDTLATIAAREYRDPRRWRPIAEANGIDNPLDLRPGTTLLLPALRIS